MISGSRGRAAGRPVDADEPLLLHVRVVVAVLVEAVLRIHLRALEVSGEG